MKKPEEEEEKPHQESIKEQPFDPENVSFHILHSQISDCSERCS